MALAPYFERVYGAVGGHLAVSRDSLTQMLNGVVPRIVYGENSSENDYWIAELATNLLARLYPRLCLTGGGDSVKELQRIATEINPEIELVFDSPGTMSICLGGAIAENALYPSASGWVARLTHDASDSRRSSAGPSNPYASAAAAILACSELFRRVFLHTSQERDYSISLLNFDSDFGADLDLPSADVGTVLFVGVGAVGNAALWALGRHKSVSGHVTLIDPESLSLLNLQRYVLGTYRDVGRPKTNIGREALARTALEVTEAQSSLEDFAELSGGVNAPTLAISLDNVAGRRAAQALLPRLIVNGWTGEQALGASWHTFDGNAACLACLYHPRREGTSATEQAARALGLSAERAALLWVTRQPLTDVDISAASTALGVDVSVLAPWRDRPIGDLYTDMVCGAVPLDVAGVGRLETVPLAHQSAMAGVLLAVALVKRTQTMLGAAAEQETLVSWDDILRPPPATWAKPRAREGGCICGDVDYQAVYMRKWRSTL